MSFVNHFLKIFTHKHIDELVKILFKMPKTGQTKDGNVAKSGSGNAAKAGSANAAEKVAKADAVKAAEKVAETAAEKPTKSAEAKNVTETVQKSMKKLMKVKSGNAADGAKRKAKK